MKNHKQRATILSIAHPNKIFEVKINNYPKDDFTLLTTENDNMLLPLPKEKFGYYFEVGDDIEFKKLAGSEFEIVNLSCEVLRISRFKREMISILRRLDNYTHPQKRCVLLNEDDFILLSAKNNPEKSNFILKRKIN